MNYHLSSTHNYLKRTRRTEQLGHTFLEMNHPSYFVTQIPETRDGSQDDINTMILFNWFVWFVPNRLLKIITADFLVLIKNIFGEHLRNLQKRKEKPEGKWVVNYF